MHSIHYLGQVNAVEENQATADTSQTTHPNPLSRSDTCYNEHLLYVTCPKPHTLASWGCVRFASL